MFVAVALSLSCFGTACIGDGAVDIVLLWPDDPALSPSAEQVFEVTLVRTAPGEATQRSVHQVFDSGDAASLGDVDAGEGVRLAVELRSPNQRLIGYGRSHGALSIEPGQSISVPMNVRRPFVYLSGDTTLSAFDPTRDGDDTQYRTDIPAIASPRVTTTSADGSSLYAVTSAPALVALATSDHATQLLDPVSLPLPASDLAVTADGRYAIVGHGTGGGGVSVVDLAAAIDGSPSVTAVDTGGPVHRVVVASESSQARAFALIDGDLDCVGGPSRLLAIDLESATASDIVTLSSVAQDLTASPDGGRLFVASACDDVVLGVVLDQEPSVAQELARVPGVTALATQEGRIWAIGQLSPTPDTGARLVAVSMDTDGNEQASLEMPVLQERAKTLEFSGEGDESVRQIDADEVVALHAAVLPGSDALAIVTQGYFHAPDRGEFIDILGIPVPILPEMELRTHEYLLVDTATGTVVQRVRSRCELDQLSFEALVTDWECTQTPGQEVTPREYQPTGVSVLYGAQ